MRSHGLLLVLESFVQSSLAGFSMPYPDNTHATPAVFLGALPEADAVNLSRRFPYVLLRLKECSDDEGGMCTETVEMLLGVYCPVDCREGELLSAALADRLRAALMRTRVLSRRFGLHLPVLGHRPDREGCAGHRITLTTAWEHLTPDRPLPYDYIDNPEAPNCRLGGKR